MIWRWSIRGEPVFSSDLLVVLDVPQPDPDEDERMAWVVADEGKGPDLLLEVLHQGNRDKDLINNVRDYARLGVREYFVYDRLRFRLYGYRLARPGAGYQELSSRLGRLTSEVLGLDLALVGRRLRFFSGMAELPNSEEFIERLSKMMEGASRRGPSRPRRRPSRLKHRHAMRCWTWRRHMAWRSRRSAGSRYNRRAFRTWLRFEPRSRPGAPGPDLFRARGTRGSARSSTSPIRRP